jgi:protein O-mannosyl-transferase
MSRLTLHKGAWFVFLLLGPLIYSNTFSVPFLYDDTFFIAENPAVRNILDLKTLWLFWPTRFIPFLSFAVNYALHKLHLFGYHFVNLLIHLGAALLVWWLARLVFATPAMKESRSSRSADLMPVFAGLIFLTHPLQTQSVTYIFQRCTSLVGFFYLFSLCCYFKSRLLQVSDIPAPKMRLWYAFSLTLAVMAMLTKENAMTLPLAVILCEVMFFKESKSIKWRNVIPFLLLLPIVIFLLTLATTEASEDMQRFLSLAIVRKHYFFTELRVLITYMRLLLFPVNQNLEYDYPIAMTFFNLPTISSALFLMGVVLFAIRIYRNHRLLSFGVFWFFLTLSAESTFMPLKDVIFEHRLYLPMVGFAFFTAAGIMTSLERKAFRFRLALLICLVTTYSFLTYQRNKVWASEMALWSDVVSKSPQKETAYNNRGIAYETEGDLGQAFLDYNRAIEIRPDYVLAYCNRGNIYLKKGDLDKAIADYSKAMSLRPEYFKAYNNRGIAYQAQRNLDKAIADFNQAISLNPRFAEAYNNRGVIYESKGDLDKAIMDYSRAIAILADYAEAFCNRGGVYLDKEDLDKAVADFNQAISLNPGYAQAYNNRGIAYQRKGKINQAILDYNQAIACKPDFAQALGNRAMAYFELQAYEQSWQDLRTAEGLGFRFSPEFIQDLQKASTRKE